MSCAENRKIAIDSYNRAQELFHSVRTPDEDKELLQSALTSRHHWRLVGGEEQFAISDWLMSRIYVAFNQPRLAVEFAISSLSHNQSGFPLWLKASLYEGMARAYKCASVDKEFDHFRELATQTLQNEPDPEDRQLIAAQIAELSSL